MITFLYGCKSENNKGTIPGGYNVDLTNPGEDYLDIDEKDFINTSDKKTSTFSLDSSTAAYSNIRRLINNGSKVSTDAVVIEQMLNYFNYDYESPVDKPLKIYTELTDCPWNSENKIAAIAVKSKNYEIDTDVKNNFVFLLDVSGSMYDEDKLPLMQQSFKILVDNLGENDTVSIVTYASGDKVLLNGAKGFEKNKICAVIEDLEAGGSTAGAKGIQTAYEIAEQYFIRNGNNRIFLATDGDFNVGISNISSLEKFISQKRETGIFLSVLGFGTGNLKSSTMDTLASKGNGNYYYIDSLLEARKVFVEQLGGTLNTVAKDCKTQVEFNETLIKKYRLLGYENKMLSDKDFENDNKDAGEIGAGHTTIALYEIVLHDNITNINHDPYFNVSLRYKEPTSEISQLIQEFCSEESPASQNITFACIVVEFALLLRDSKYKGNATYQHLLEIIDENNQLNDDLYKKELFQLIHKQSLKE